MTVDPQNKYTQMQFNQYEATHHLMARENHMFHNRNPDYWDILVSDTKSGFEDKVGLDFGCGCGRNVQNLWRRFRRMDGVDISPGNLEHARHNMLNIERAPADRFAFHHCSGVDLSNLPSDEYDFVMSTIVLQHICVHEIRFSYLKEFYRIMKPGALLSFQMGYGPKHGIDYYENFYDAKGTNSLCDCHVTDPAQIEGDLQKIGFKDITHTITRSFEDLHEQWIYVKARK